MSIKIKRYTMSLKIGTKVKLTVDNKPEGEIMNVLKKSDQKVYIVAFKQKETWRVKGFYRNDLKIVK